MAPSTPTVTFGLTQQFTATVNGTNNPSQAVTWKATYGTITSAGLYTAPASGTTDTVTATSVENTAISGNADVTLTDSTVTSVTVSPGTPTVTVGNTQQFTAAVNGTNNPSQAVTWKATYGTINASGLYTAPASGTTDTVTATSVQKNTISGTATVTLPSTVTSVTVAPSTPTMTFGNTQQFTATVNGTNNPSQAVTWKATYGTITSAGLYTAPASGTTDTVTATSVQNSTISGTAAVTLTTATMTVTGTIMVNYQPYNAGTQTITPDPLPRSNVLSVEAIVTGSSYPGTYNVTTGGFSIPNVPVGYYTLVMTATTRTFTFYSNQPNIVLDYDQQGRSTVQYPTTSSTDVIFNTGGMTAWTANDYSYLTFFDPNAYLYCEPDSICYTGYPVVGATALSGLGVNWYNNGLPLVDTTQGDAPILEQMVDTTPAGPSHLVTGQNLYYPTPLTILNSSGATIGGSFSPETQSGSVTVIYERSGFAAYRSDFNTGATHRSPHFEVDDSPGAGTYYQTDSNSMDRLWFLDHTSTGDVNLGSVPMPPILPGFDRVYNAGQHSYMVYQLPGNSANQTTWHSIYALSQTAPTSGSPIVPVVSHPRNLMIGSTSMLSGAGILATGVGTTPTFTWQAPALGTPQGYKVDVYQVQASGGQTHVSGSILRMFTTATQVQCPSNVLLSGNFYIFEVTAFADSSYAPLTAPFHVMKLPCAYARNVSGIFAPSADPIVTSVTVSPSTQSVTYGLTQQFTATVNGMNNPSQAVTWTATYGTITSGGLYTAPAAGANDTVTAASVQNTAISGTAAVTLTAPTSTVTSVTVSPSTLSVTFGNTQQFTATVNGTNGPSQAVTWTAIYGTITSAGLYTAPASGTTDTVTARSVQNTGYSGTATVTLGPLPTISSFTANQSTVASGVPTMLSWSTTGATSLSIDNGVGAVTGSTWVMVYPITTTTYHLTAQNGEGTAPLQAVTVTVTGNVTYADTFTQTTSMWVSDTTTVVGNGKVFMTDGETTSTVVYDIASTATSAGPTLANQHSGSYGMNVALPGGNQLLLISGAHSWDSTLVTTTAVDRVTYTPGTNTWTSTSMTPLLVGRANHTCTLLPNGTILIAGGFTVNSTSSIVATAEMEIYNPEGNGSVTFLGNLPINLALQNAIYSNGKVYLVGGVSFSNGNPSWAPNVLIVDPTTGNVTTGAAIPSGGIVTPCWVPLANGTTLMAGGVTGDLTNPNTVNASYIFNPAGNSGAGVFTATGNLHVARWNAPCSLLANGKVLVAGGGPTWQPYTDLSSVEIFDPTANGNVGAFTLLSSTMVIGQECAAALLPNGHVLFPGGNSGEDSNGGGTNINIAQLFK
jgi:hypothetical protein